MPSKQKMDIKDGKNRILHPNHRSCNLSFGQRAADLVTVFVGSWFFIITVIILLIVWIAVNVVAWIETWDPYPFILLNFVLSCLAALQAPIILMSQNRSAEKDRLRVEYDYAVDRKAEREIQDIQKDLEVIKKLIKNKK